jgi:hypothetical protein
VDGCRINGAVNLREETEAAAEDSPARFFSRAPYLAWLAVFRYFASSFLASYRRFQGALLGSVRFNPVDGGDDGFVPRTALV